MVKKPHLFFAFVLALLTACSNLGMNAAKSPEDVFRYSQATMTGIYKTLGEAAEQKALPPNDLKTYFAQLEPAYADMAVVDKAMRSTGGRVPDDMLARMAQANSLLLLIAGELRSRLPAEQTRAIPTTTKVTP